MLHQEWVPLQILMLNTRRMPTCLPLERMHFEVHLYNEVLQKPNIHRHIRHYRTRVFEVLHHIYVRDDGLVFDESTPQNENYQHCYPINNDTSFTPVNMNNCSGYIQTSTINVNVHGIPNNRNRMIPSLQDTFSRLRAGWIWVREIGGRDIDCFTF
jgi:hypothetical protein